ncbi:MAG: hypothetical protein LBN38_07815, partial [Verrucomicrobiota bacterium]|nr:hypothetical protein [Verrucomicrobiota bacterium]
QHLFGRTGERMVDYYIKTAGMGALFWLAWCALLGIWKRNRVITALLLPAALLHFLFYACYKTFVPRYLYSAAIFAIPVMAWGLLTTLQAVFFRLSAPFRCRITGAVAGAMAVFTVVSLGTLQPSRPGFQIAQARRLKQDLEAQLPPGGVVFAQRYLCEIIRWFTHVHSFPISGLIGYDVPAESALRDALKPYFERQVPVYALEHISASKRELDSTLLKRLCAHDFQFARPFKDYHLKGRDGAHEFHVFRLNGFGTERPVLPSIEDAKTRPVVYDFAIDAFPVATELLSGELSAATLVRQAPRITSQARIRLPGVLATNEIAVFEFRMRSAQIAEGGVVIDIELEGSAAQQVTLPHDRSWQQRAIHLMGPVQDPVLTLRSSSAVDLHELEVHILAPSDHLRVDVGATGDTLYLRQGWHNRETAGGNTMRWSQPSASWTWPVESEGRTARVQLHTRPNRPELAEAPRLFCNGRAFPMEAFGEGRFTVDLPAGLLEAFNVFQLSVPGWTPGPHDPRSLGLLVDWISMETPAQEDVP